MDEKKKRQRNALIVGAVLLILVLLSVMIYQIIAISGKNAQINELNQKIAEYHRMVEEGRDQIETTEMYEYIVQRARELGYAFDGDKLYK